VAFICATRKAKLARQQAIEGGGINPPPACNTNGQPRNTPAPAACRLRANAGRSGGFGWCEEVCFSSHFAIALRLGDGRVPTGLC
jgi:hypothetical protein